MKKLFTNDKFFFVMVILGFFGTILAAIINAFIMPEYAMTIAPYFIEALCLLFLRSSYVKHSKNVMKGLMGALLMSGLLTNISLLSSAVLPIDKVLMPISLALFVVLFISHFIINSDHHSKPGFIKLNQAMCALIAVVGIVWNIAWACVYSDVLSLLGEITSAAGIIGIFASVVCVESRLDAYRLDREAAGWTEEAGYPEGYVHEYEKK